MEEFLNECPQYGTLVQYQLVFLHDSSKNLEEKCLQISLEFFPQSIEKNNGFLDIYDILPYRKKHRTARLDNTTQHHQRQRKMSEEDECHLNSVRPILFERVTQELF